MPLALERVVVSPQLQKPSFDLAYHLPSHVESLLDYDKTVVL